MTDTKLTCYIKSFKHDTNELKDDLISIIKTIVRTIALPLVIILVAGIIGYAFYTNAVLFTQYTTYLIILAITDGLVMIFVHKMQEGAAYNLGHIAVPILLMLMFIGTLWILNACTVVSPNYSDVTHGWSFMDLETGVDILVMGFIIFCMRAYSRCKKPID
jgi:hypothetical protein